MNKIFNSQIVAVKLFLIFLFILFFSILREVVVFCNVVQLLSKDFAI